MITAIYAALSALLIIYLSLNVIKERRQNKVLYGDGGNEDLQIARSAQSNATEYIPIALLLLFTLEYNRGNNWVIHALGISLIVGRSIHAQSLLSKNRRGRVLGMQITIFTIIGLAILNLFYAPYSQLFKI